MNNISYDDNKMQVVSSESDFTGMSHSMLNEPTVEIFKVLMTPRNRQDISNFDNITIMEPT
jgi:hypothetical protein